MDGTTSDETKTVNSDQNDEKSHLKQWHWKSNELKKALNEWTQLSEHAPGPGPDEQMLQDMQKLIKEITAKLEQFKE